MKQKEFLKKNKSCTVDSSLSLSLNFIHTHTYTQATWEKICSRLLNYWEMTPLFFPLLTAWHYFFFFLFLRNKIIWSLLNSSKGLEGRLCPASSRSFLLFSLIFMPNATIINEWWLPRLLLTLMWEEIWQQPGRLKHLKLWST